MQIKKKRYACDIFIFSVHFKKIQQDNYAWSIKNFSIFIFTSKIGLSICLIFTKLNFFLFKLKKSNTK